MGHSYRWAAGIVATGSALLALACLDMDTADTADRLERGLPRRAGYAIEAPFAYLDERGQVTGEAPEILRRALRGAGIDGIEWIHADFGDLIHDLEVGRIDVIAAGLFVTPDRAARVAFTRPTALVRTGLLVPADNPRRLRTLASIAADPGARLAVIEGAVEARQAAAVGVPEQRIGAYPDARSAVAAVQSGHAHAFALSAVSLRSILLGIDGHGLAVVTAPTSVTVTGEGDSGLPALAFRRDDKWLRDRVDGVLAKFVGSSAHLDLVRPFGFGPDEIAPVVETAKPGRKP